MYNEELKAALLKMHAKDKRLTFINYSLIAVVIIVLAAFLGRYVLGFIQIDAWYPKVALGFAVVMYTGYAVSKIVKITKRTKDIDALFEKVEAGAKATNIMDTKEYKIIIPLGKITFKLCPIDFLMITLDKEPGKMYTIPVHAAFTPDLKNILSGADMEKIMDTLTDIYREEDGEDALGKYENESTPLKSVEEFREFLNTELGDSVKDVEETRKKSRKTKLMLMVGTFIVIGGYMGYIYYNAFTKGATFDTSQMYIPMIILFVGFYAFYFVFIRPKQMKAFKEGGGTIEHAADYAFKTKVFERIVKFVSPNAQYVLHGHVSMADFMASGLFRAKHYEITGNDLIIGRHNGVPFQFCDLTASVIKRTSKENEGPDYAFYGQFFMARFNKTFSSPVYVIPKTGVKGFFSDNDISLYTEVEGEKIMLEDPEFMKMFHVYGNDQIEARYIMTPAMMERIKQLTLRTKGQYYIAFYDNRITVANNSGKNNFEMNLSKSLTKDDNKMMIDFYQDLCDQFAIVDELKLNIKIWK